MPQSSDRNFKLGQTDKAVVGQFRIIRHRKSGVLEEGNAGGSALFILVKIARPIEHSSEKFLMEIFTNITAHCGLHNTREHHH